MKARLLAVQNTGAFGANTFGSLATGNTSTATTEALRQITYRTAGTITNLSAVKTAGDRTGMQIDVSRNAGTDVGGCSIAFTSTNGEYEDTTGTNTVAAGDGISVKITIGTGGTTGLTLMSWGCLWDATGTTTTHFATSSLNYATASETSYRQPGAAAKTTTQAEGEFLIRIPAGHGPMTAKNLYVAKTNVNTQTNTITVSLNGATGAGTAPSVTFAAADGAVIREDTTNSITVNDGDKLSFKVVTGAGTVNFTPTIAIELQSDDGVFHMVTASPAGVSLGTTSFEPAAGVLLANTEAAVRAKASVIGAVASLLSAYVKTAGTTSALTLRANGANAGSPGALSVATTGTGAWVTDTTNSYRVLPADELAFGSTGAAAATVTCIVIAFVAPLNRPVQVFNQAVPRAALV